LVAHRVCVVITVQHAVVLGNITYLSSAGREGRGKLEVKERLLGEVILTGRTTTEAALPSVLYT